MSAFSRGCLRQQSLFTRPVQPLQLSSYQPRFFTTTPFLQANKKSHNTPRRGSTPLDPIAPKQSPSGILPKEITIPKPTIPQNHSKPAPTKNLTISKKSLVAPSVNYKTYADSLLQKDEPSTLYIAPSHTRYFISCWATTTLFMSQAVYCTRLYLLPPDDVHYLIPYGFGIAGMLWAGLGTWLVLGASGIIRKITAIPNKTTDGSKPRSLELEVEFRKMFPMPFFPARKLYISPAEFIMYKPLNPHLNPSQMAAIKRHEEGLAREEAERLEYEEAHKATAPFRKANAAVSNAFSGLWYDTKRAWSREGFDKVRIKGRKYNMDVTSGQALDDGRALDKVVTIQQPL